MSPCLRVRNSNRSLPKRFVAALVSESQTPYPAARTRSSRCQPPFRERACGTRTPPRLAAGHAPPPSSQASAPRRAEATACADLAIPTTPEPMRPPMQFSTVEPISSPPLYKATAPLLEEAALFVQNETTQSTTHPRASIQATRPPPSAASAPLRDPHPLSPCLRPSV